MTNERREYIPCDAILAEVDESLRDHDPGEIDWVTFVGSPEPTLESFKERSDSTGDALWRALLGRFRNRVCGLTYEPDR